MAIIKEKSTNFGISASYHKLDRVELDIKNSEVLVYIATYPSAEARASATSPISIEKITVPFWRLKQDPRSLFYNMVADYDISPLYGGTADTEQSPDTFKFEVRPSPNPAVPRSDY